MRLDVLSHFIVPLTFLAIWAVTSLLNRDAQPLPPRPGRPGGPPGNRPRPVPGAAELPAARQVGAVPPSGQGRAANAATGELSARWPSQPDLGADRDRDRVGQRPKLGLDDAIVFIESNGPASRPLERDRLSAGGAGLGGTAQLGGRQGAAQARSGALRRGRNRQGNPGAAPRQTAPEPQRALTQTMSLQKTRPLEIEPLSSPLTPLSRGLSTTDSTSTSRTTTSVVIDSPPTLTAEAVKAMLVSPARLRELTILSEILQPPLALRRPRHRPGPSPRSDS